MKTERQMAAEKVEFRRDVGFAPGLPPNVLTAMFACPSCNWPIVHTMFTQRSNQDGLHDFVFELICEKCKWKGAVLGRDIVGCMINDWSARKVRAV
jgi:hypothetical protein